MTVSDSQYETVIKLADEYLARLRRGERPSVTEYVHLYPQLAEGIRDVFPISAMMEDLGSDSREHSEGGSDANRQAPADAAPPPPRLGDYRILREIGHGGMGVVYEAEHTHLRRHVALKVLHAGGRMAPGHRERFEREARAAAMLHHTNIVPVFDVGEEHGTLFYAMQFIQGHGLDKVLDELRQVYRPDRDGSAPEASVVPGSSAVGLLQARGDAQLAQSGMHYWRSVARLGIQVADALDYAHEHGTLHRDIKPSNLLLDLHGVVWVADFGLARLEDEADLTRSGEFVGTLRYMAPERFEGRCDPRSDVYSLGLTLYELATFRPAFSASSRHRLIQQVTQEEPSRPRKLNAAIPRDLETILLKAIAREPPRRYQTAAELGADLGRFLEDKPIRARPVGVWERTVKSIRRRPAVSTLAGLLVLSMLAGFALVTWKWRDAEHQRILATRQAARNDALAKAELNLRRQAEAARQAEAQQAEAARLQAAKARQVAGFLIGLFQGSDPLGISGYRFGPPPSETSVPTAHDLLRRGTERIRSELADAPEIQATVMDHLGRTWLSQGSIPDAEPLLQAALDWRRREYGMQHPDTAQSLAALGVLRYVQGNYDQAVPLLRDAATITEAMLGASDPIASRIKFLFATVLLESRGGQSAIQEAHGALEELVDALRPQAQQRRRDLAFALAGLAMAQHVRRDYAGALKSLAQATDLMSRAPASDPVVSGLILSIRAVTNWKLGNQETARQQTDACIQQFQEILGRDHPAVNYFQVYVARLIFRAGDHERAEAMLRRGVADARRAYGRQPRTAKTMALLAEVLLHRGQRDEAESICRDALSINTAILGPDSRHTAAIQRLLSRIADNR